MALDGLDMLVRLEQGDRASAGLVDGGIGLEVVGVADEVGELLIGDAQVLAQRPQPFASPLESPGVEPRWHGCTVGRDQRLGECQGICQPLWATETSETSHSLTIVVTMTRSRHSILLGLTAIGLITGGCGGEATSTATTADGAGVTGTVTVFAAASLTAAFTELGDAFEALHPDAQLVFNFAGSSALATQIGEGAPADVFASADMSNMTKLTEAGLNAAEPVVFTTNAAQIIVAAGNPLGISGVADLADPELIVVSCAPDVPCGTYAQEVFDKAGVSVTPKSLEENVKAVVAKVTLGEADAAIVYVTDVLGAADAADGVDIPAELNVVAEYPITVTREAPNPGAAQAFVDFVRSPAGQEILATFGFIEP